MNSTKPVLCNNKQTNKTKQKKPVPPPPPIPLTLANSPRVRSYLARTTAGQVQWFTWQWCTWPITGHQTLFVRREYTDSFRGYNLFTSSMQERHPRPSFMNCPYHALTGVLTGAWLRHWQRGHQTRYPAFTSFGEREPETERETVWPSSRAAARFRFGSPFSSKTAVVCGHCLVTLSSQWNIKMALIAAHLMQESFWWWQCSDIYGGGRVYIYILFPPPHNTPSPSPRFYYRP